MPPEVRPLQLSTLYPINTSRPINRTCLALGAGAVNLIVLRNTFCLLYSEQAVFSESAFIREMTVLYER